MDSAYTLKWIFFFTSSILPWSSCWWSMSNWHILLAQSIFSSIKGNTLSEVANLKVASNGCHMGTPTLQGAINTRSYEGEHLERIHALVKLLQTQNKFWKTQSREQNHMLYTAQNTSCLSYPIDSNNKTVFQRTIWFPWSYPSQ